VFCSVPTIYAHRKLAAVNPVRWPVVVFDLDGTVADTIGLIIASYDHAVNEVLGYHLDPDLCRSWIGQTLVATFRSLWPGQADELVASYREFNELHHDDWVAQYPGVRELLSELTAAGVATGIATAKSREKAERSVSVLGLPVAVTVAMEDTSAHKPDPAPLLLAVDRLGGTPRQAVYVGDAVVDVHAAKAAGMASIAVTWGAGHPDALAAAGPTAAATTADELRALLLG
jgi:pyrophosphatase PpaX